MSNSIIHSGTVNHIGISNELLKNDILIAEYSRVKSEPKKYKWLLKELKSIIKKINKKGLIIDTTKKVYIYLC